MDPEKFSRLTELLPYGSKQRVFVALAEQLIALLEVGGDLVVGAITSGQMGIGYCNVEIRGLKSFADQSE